MAELEGDLKKSGQVTLNASGNGVLSFSTDHANQRWEVTSVVVSTNQNANAVVVPFVTLAENTTDISTLSAGNQRGSTWNGDKETFAGLWKLGPMDFLSVFFAPPTGQSGASMSGVIASAVVSGTKYTRR
jgi:hypothetical protein